jgi:tRNA A37 threonylcarbamoyladenosine dehydratase
MNQFSRTELILGRSALDKLHQSTVAVYGVGGVGSYTLEGLARAGVGNFVIVDDDTICITNLNRQIHATHKTVGHSKVEVMKQRILEINPNAKVIAYHAFYSPETSHETLKQGYDYIVDAIDNVTGKIDLAVKAGELGIPIISSMGTGNKLDPTQLEVADIYATSVCPLAKVVRRLLKERGVKALRVVYSKEQPIKPIEMEHLSCKTNCVCPDNGAKHCTVRHQVPGSVSFVPSVAGFILAGVVIKDLIGR